MHSFKRSRRFTVSTRYSLRYRSLVLFQLYVIGQLFKLGFNHRVYYIISLKVVKVYRKGTLAILEWRFFLVFVYERADRLIVFQYGDIPYRMSAR